MGKVRDKRSTSAKDFYQTVVEKRGARIGDARKLMPNLREIRAGGGKKKTTGVVVSLSLWKNMAPMRKCLQKKKKEINGI